MGRGRDGMKQSCVDSEDGRGVCEMHGCGGGTVVRVV